MGTYVFKWTKPASEVYVTGTFDDWAKTNKLTKDGDVFSKRVELPSSTEEYYFKYFVDGKWELDTDHPTANDASGNTNNLLHADSIEPLAAGSHMMSNVTPAATTAALAAAVPLEKSAKTGATDDDMPGAFPEDFATPLQQPTDFDLKSVPKTEGLETAAPTEETTFGVSPIPASNSFGNPVQVKPGDSLPPTQSHTVSDLNSHVKLDKEAYEKSDAYPASSNITSTQPASTSAFDVPPVSNTTIPESSLPMGSAAIDGVGVDSGPTIASSAGVATTTAALAGQVPLEPRGVPEIVRESQDEINAPHEASDSPEAVAQKDKVEEELQKKVPEEPATSEDSPAAKTTGGMMAAGAAALSGLAAGVAAYATAGTQKAQQAVQDVQAGINPITGSGGEAKPEDTASNVPQVVAESFEKANESPEAAANASAVAQKAATESELESKVPTTDEAAGVGPSETSTAALTSTAPSATATGYSTDPVIADSNTMPAISVANGDAETSATDDALKDDPTKATYTDQAAETAKEAGAAVTGAVAAGAAAVGLGSVVGDKDKAADAKIDAPKSEPSKATTTEQTSGTDTSGLNAPATSQAQTAATVSANEPAPSSAAHTSQTASTAGAGGSLAAALKKPRSESRDISPMTRGPAVTTGVESGKTAEKQQSGWKSGAGVEGKSTTQKVKDTVAEAASAATATTSTSNSATKEEKKKNRRSFFGKIKDKIKHSS